MLHEKEHADALRKGVSMVYVRCSNCGGTLGADEFSSLHSELSWRGWALVLGADGALSLFCARCVDVCDPSHKWRGTMLVAYGDAIRRLMIEVPE